MGNDEVAITGIGMVTPLGATTAETLQAWRSGNIAPRHVLPELEGTPLAHCEAATPPWFDPGERLGGRRMLKYMSAAAVLGCTAAREALRSAGVENQYAADRIGLYAATGLAAASVEDIQQTLEASLDPQGVYSERLLGKNGLAATNPLISFKILANMPPCLISIMEKIKGPNLIFSPWEGQAGAALLEAWQGIHSGAVDCAVTGAADSAANPSTCVFLHQAGLLRRDETPASGAGYLVFERGATARRLGHTVYAYVEDIALSPSDAGVHDPLAIRIGRLFAAAPPVLLGLECLAGGSSLTLCGVDRQRLDIKLRAPE